MKTMVAVVLLLVAQLSQVSLFEGDWRTDVPPDLKSSSIAAVPSGISFGVTADKVTVTNRSVSPNGSSRASNEVLQTDGKPHPSTLGETWTVVAMWSNPYLLDVMYTGRGVRVVTVHVTYSLSADQKTLTRRSVYSANDYIEERVFYR
jgi:hypothetical protein